MGRKYGIAVCNGTAALDVAVEALGVGPGDEVILPTFTIISCILQIVRSGATPVLVDSDPETWNMDVSQIEEKITPRTKAIMVVHIFGLPVDMDPVLDIARRHGLKIIEDAAEMIGQDYRGKPCGSFGDISTFSFYPNKHVTTGEGGMVLTDDEELAEVCRSLRNLCFQSKKRFVHERLGWNLRMTNLQAALGLAQLERLEEHVKIKQEMGKKYDQLLAHTCGIQLPLPSTEYANNIYWVYGIVLKEKFSVDAKRVMAKLKEHGIGSRPFFWPMHQQPILQSMGLFEKERYLVAENIARQGFYIPSGMALNEGQINRAGVALKRVFGQVRAECKDFLIPWGNSMLLTPGSLLGA
jgi:perosamine synthetase